MNKESIIILENWKKTNFKLENMKMINAITDVIEALKQPEVVRCWECKWFVKSEKTNKKWCGWHSEDSGFEVVMYDDDFCSYGEIKQDF